MGGGGGNESEKRRGQGVWEGKQDRVRWGGYWQGLRREDGALGTDIEILVHRLLGQVDHVRREKGLAVSLVVALARLEHTIEPRKQLLGTVVGVEDDGHTVLLRHRTHVECTGDSSGDRSLEVGVVQPLARVKLATP